MKTVIPVAITGLGCICAPGNTLPECMDALFRERKDPAPPRLFVSNHTTSYPAFELSDDFMSIEARGIPDITRTGKLALVAAHEAIENAGLDGDTLRRKRVGVCMGTTVGTTMNNEAFYRKYLKQEEPDMVNITRFLNSNPAAIIAREFDLCGPCQTVVNACSSGTDAVGLGALWINSGLCDIVLAGGADELCHVTYNGFISLMITDTVPCKPFDRDRKGLNLGEGAAMLVLESKHQSGNGTGRPEPLSWAMGLPAMPIISLHRILKDGDSDGPLRKLWCRAMSSANDIAFVNAHGTGTLDNDRTESLVLADMLPGVPFLSTKGYTGHTLGAAGAIEAAFTVACLEMGKIPKNAGFTTPDPDLPVTPARVETTITGNVALSESLAFGGHNGVLAIGLEGGQS